MSDENQSVKTSWTSIQVYALSVLFLLAGVTAGYLARGSRSSKISGETASAMTQAQGGTSTQPGVIPPGVTPEQMTPDQLKRMADKKVAPLLQQLNENPNDRDKLIEVGGDYYLAQQFNEAAAYYEKAAHVKQTADILTKLSNAQFYGGSGEKAISTLDRALQLDPKFANALYNLGMLKWQVRGDMKGAIASWEKLLKITDPKNPNRANLEKMVAAAKEHEKMSAGNKKTDKPGM